LLFPPGWESLLQKIIFYREPVRFAALTLQDYGSRKQRIASFKNGNSARKEKEKKEMKVRKWTTLVVVLGLLFSVGCATGAATSAKPRTN
jgi:hypothetical protein